MAKELPKMTRKELEKYTGLDGRATYVAYQGKVYDVTDSLLFTDGMHFEHYAGEDLTEAMVDAPHGEDIFEDFPVVAILED